MIFLSSAVQSVLIRILKKACVLACVLLLGLLFVPVSAQAKGPEVGSVLKKMLGSLPIGEHRDQLQKMVSELKETSCGGGLTGCYQAKTGPLQLYFFTSKNTQQTFIIAIDKKIAMPNLLGNKVQQVMGQTSLSAPIISISTTDFDLTTARMPPDLKKIVYDSYFNVSALSFSAGVQMAARANLGGPIKLTMESLGVRADQLTMRAGVVMPIPTDISGGAGTGLDIANSVAEGNTMKKSAFDAAKPEAYVEFQFAPNSRLPMLLPPVTLTDATFFINNNLTFGYKGNAQFQGVGNKNILLQFQTPLTPAGAMDLLDFEFRMATPAAFTLEDAARVMIAMASPDARLAKYGGGFIKGIGSFKDPLLTMVKPLSMFKMKNPNPPPEYKFGDATKPWPEDMKYYNIAIYGPLASGGPYYFSGGQVAAFGQTLGWTEVSAGMNGFYNGSGADVSLKLGPLGKVPFKLSQENRIGVLTQDMTLKGNLAGQKISVTMGYTKMGIEVSASCINPFEIKASAEITPSLDLAQLFDAQAGVNVDPSKITGCIGKELEAAYKKIANEYKHLEGYTAAMANAELKKIADAATLAAKQAEDAAKKAAAESQKAAEEAAKASQKAADDAAKAAEKAAADARRQYEQTKDAARDVASKATNSAANAFRDAGNAFKKIGKKKKRKKGPDPKFSGSVFDWDYYYDNNPDVVAAKVDLSTHWRDNGFREGRRGSLEFQASYYLNRYPDVKAKCGNDLQCALQHWLDDGIELGRQGSPDVNIYDYMNRYGDVPKTLAPEDDPDALEHWLTVGADAGRDGSPASKATSAFSAPMRAGGNGGGPWNDSAQCQRGEVRGFRISVGKRVDGLQFLYSTGQWGAVHGKLNKGWTEHVFAGDEYAVRVDYRSGGSMDAFGIVTNKRGIGMFGGGGGSFGSYSVTPGQRLTCMMGRSGKEVDQIILSSTGLR